MHDAPRDAEVSFVDTFEPWEPAGCGAPPPGTGRQPADIRRKGPLGSVARFGASTGAYSSSQVRQSPPPTGDLE